MLLLLWSTSFAFFILPTVRAQVEYCPDGWEEGPHLCYRFTDKKVKFRKAVVECLTSDPAHYGPTVNLIRVGQLRKLANVSATRDVKKRKIRVDAIKSEDGLWREYTTRQPVNFERFPTFNAANGLTGQTLLFDQNTNQLELAFEGEEYRGICYRRKFGALQFERCNAAGSKNECSDRGDCVNGACVCDQGFSGPLCAIGGAAVREDEGEDDVKARTNCQEFVRDDGSLACYTLEAEGVSYQEALEACSGRGFTLAEVHGERDQDNLKAMAQPFKNAWIGLTDLDGDGDFSWISGRAVAYTNWAVDVADRASLPCVALDPVNDFKWNDVGCDATFNYVAICRVY